MANSTIPLAKGMDLSKMDFPALLSIKYDGVPVKLMIAVCYDGITWTALSRQGKPLPALDRDMHEFVRFVSRHLKIGLHVFVFETTHVTLKDFKDVSGLVRKKEPQEGFIYHMFDYWWDGEPAGRFDQRTDAGARLVYKAHLPNFHSAQQWAVKDAVDAEGMIAHFQRKWPNAEGFIMRAADAAFKPNTRHWDYQKIVVDPTADLMITGFEEAVNADGEPLGMVGRLIAEYNGKEIGVGPGKLTHKERKELWSTWFAPTIATIKYKRDPSYDSLRQPTFQHWRPERTDTSV